MNAHTVEKPDPTFVACGRYLRDMRMQMGIPIETVSKETSINIWHLGIIEAEAYHQLPEDLDVQTILRKYAGYIGVDADDILSRYAINRAAHQRRPRSPGRSNRFYKKKGFRRALMLLMPIISIVLSIYLIYTYRLNPSSKEIVQNSGAGDVTLSWAVEDLSLPAFSADPNDRLCLRIEAVEDADLKIFVDDKDPVEYLMHSNDLIEMEAISKIRMSVNNVAGIKIFLNNQQMYVSEKKGDAAYIELP